MSTKNKIDNPPAFPLFVSDDSLANEFNSQGMTLRDYFAAKVLQSTPIGSLAAYCPQVAKQAYEMADEMLKARQSVYQQ